MVPVLGTDKKRLEIWRASTDLPGYIACIEEKRQAIRGIWREINHFMMRSDAKKSISILLQADPGAGKSFLAERLAKQVGDVQLIKADISQMTHREDLIALFDRLATEQARMEEGKKAFVFVDEINARLDNSSVYGMFLAPLEAGYYMRGDVLVPLKPCIWMFAGTTGTKGDRSDGGPEDKRQDFESRLTLTERIDFQGMALRAGHGNEKRLERQARLEQVYILIP